MIIISVMASKSEKKKYSAGWLAYRYFKLYSCMASFGGHATAQRQMDGVSFRLDGRREKVGNQKKKIV
jgi:hypothetical protein